MRLQRVVPSIALFVPLVTSLIALVYTTDAVHQSYAKEHAHIKASRSPSYNGSNSHEYSNSMGSGNGAGREINLNIELAGGKSAFADVPSTVVSYSSLQITNTVSGILIRESNYFFKRDAILFCCDLKCRNGMSWFMLMYVYLFCLVASFDVEDL